MKDSPIGETPSRTKSEVETLVCIKKSRGTALRIAKRKKSRGTAPRISEKEKNRGAAPRMSEKEKSRGAAPRMAERKKSRELISLLCYFEFTTSGFVCCF